VAGAARKLGAKVVAEQVDFADGDSVARFVDKALKELGTVHVAINNAVDRGTASGFIAVSDEAWESNFRVNLGGPRNVCRNVLPLMVKRKWGRIINLAGIDPFFGGSVTKGIAKLGIIGFARGLAREFAEHDITANCIGPGSTEVERDALQKPKGLEPLQPIRRLGKPHEVVSLMMYLASEDAGYITGQAYLANGGLNFH
jgi:NAD(P)-dependent dehydrogenase (short-subunit alcohol dehydrogenase family)